MTEYERLKAQKEEMESARRYRDFVSTIENMDLEQLCAVLGYTIHRITELKEGG